MTNFLRLATVEVHGATHVAVVVEQGHALLESLVDDAPSTMVQVIESWESLGPQVSTAATSHLGWVDNSNATWAPPLVPGKLLCVGSNYHDHVAEMTGPAGLAVRPQPFPFSFLKPATALCGSGATVTRPSYGHKLDWEVELGVVIGDPAKATGPEPLDAVFGYTIVNDLSMRDFIPFPHTLGLDAVVSKGFDGAAPIGPWISLASDIEDPQDLRISLSLNGETMQDGTTASMIFDIREMIRHYARVLSLCPGDVIATGTPAGVGAAKSPQRFLQAGDSVNASVEGIGSLITHIGPPLSEDPLPTSADMRVGA